MSEVKDYLKEHKKEIAIGVLCGVGGCIIGGAIMKHKLGIKLKALGVLDEFGKEFLEDTVKAIGDSNHADVFICETEDVLSNIGATVAEYYAGEGIGLDTPITGFLTFTKK